MKRLICLAAGFCLLAATSVPAAAQYSLKWEQPPNCIDGFNTLSYRFLPEYFIVADDFQCNDPRPIARIRWWGSFANWMPNEPVWEVPPENPFGLPATFLISWHSYTHPEGEYSRPDGIIFEEGIPVAAVEVGWWCSHKSWDSLTEPYVYEHEYYFECDLTMPFFQEEGQYYFVNIVADYAAPPLHHWGWKNSEFNWNDDAVQSLFAGAPGTWNELTWPEGHRLEGQSMDMAFELYVQTTPSPAPTATPPPTIPPTPPPTIPPSPTPTPKPSATPTVRATGTLTPPPTVPPTPPPTISPPPVPTCSVSCGFQVSGAVLDGTIFSPLTGAAVTMTYSDLQFDTTVSGAGGTYNFEIPNHHSPGPVTLEAEYPGYRTGYAYTAWECYSEITGLDIHLARITPTSTPPGYRTPTPPPAGRWIHDYNGDGTSDIAIFRPSSGLWAVRGITRLYFGSSTDTLIPGDYRGDGTTIPAVFRQASGLWAVRGLTRLYFGSSADLPQPLDYSGDGMSDIAVFRPSSGLWAVRGFTRIYFGSSTDRPVPGYYAAGPAAPAIFRPSTGLWAVRGLTRVYFGTATDLNVPGDYSNSGGWSPAIFRPSTGLWAVRGWSRVYFGTATDITVPGGYAGDGADRIGIFRPPSGLWTVRGLTRIYFGRTLDIPVAR